MIDTRDYFLEVSRYIHLNPVEAKMVRSPKDYRWSSYFAYISYEVNPHITTAKILSPFPGRRKKVTVNL
jgi:putative transposase